MQVLEFNSPSLGINVSLRKWKWIWRRFSKQDCRVIYTWSQHHRGATVRGTSPWFIPSVTFARVAIGWALIRHLWLLALHLHLSQNSQWSGLHTAKSVKEILVLWILPTQTRLSFIVLYLYTALLLLLTWEHVGKYINLHENKHTLVSFFQRSCFIQYGFKVARSPGIGALEKWYIFHGIILTLYAHIFDDRMRQTGVFHGAWQFYLTLKLLFLPQFLIK